MGYPTLLSATAKGRGGSSSVTGITNPATPGQLAFLFVWNYLSTGASRTFTVSGGSGTWNVLTGASGSGVGLWGAWYSIDHDGSDLTVTGAGSGQWGSVSMAFSGVDTANPIEAYYCGSGTNTNVTWSSFSPASGIADDYYWLAACGNCRGGSSTENFSSNMTDTQTYSYGNSAQSSSSVGVTVAGQKAHASSFTPNSVTWDGSAGVGGRYEFGFIVRPGSNLLVPNKAIIIP